MRESEETADFTKQFDRALWLKISILIAAILVAIGFIALTQRDSLEGNWRNHWLGSCLCDSYNFLEFKNGSIRFVSDVHLSGEKLGTYRKVGKNTFEIEFDDADSSPLKFTVRPKLTHFMLPAEQGVPDDHWLARSFYRPFDSRKADAIVLGISARNREILKQEEIFERLGNREGTSSALE